MVDVHARYLRSLEQAGRLDRALEFLPDDETLTERKAAGQGLTSPEFAILLSYTKVGLYEELLASDLPDDPHLAAELERYFPTAVRQRFRTRLARHPLRREIVAAQFTNGLVNRVGTTFVFRLGEETGATGPDIARAFAVARDVFDLRACGARSRRSTAVSRRRRSSPCSSRRGSCSSARPAGSCATGRGRSRSPRLPRTSARGARSLAASVADVLGAPDRDAARRTAEGLAAAGVPQSARRTASGTSSRLLPALDLVEVAAATGSSFEEVAGVYFAIDDRLELHALRDRIAALPREERWDALARRALWEDLQGEHRTLTVDVLRESENGPYGELLSSWIAHNAAAVDRCMQVLADVKAGDAPISRRSRSRSARSATSSTRPPLLCARRQPVEQPAAPVAGS